MKFAFHRHPPASVFGPCSKNCIIFFHYFEKKMHFEKKKNWFFFFNFEHFTHQKMIIREYSFIKTDLGYKGVKPT